MRFDGRVLRERAAWGRAKTAGNQNETGEFLVSMAKPPVLSMHVRPTGLALR